VNDSEMYSTSILYVELEQFVKKTGPDQFGNLSPGSAESISDEC